MPIGNGKGTEGMGPSTGRGLGYCNDYVNPGFNIGTPHVGAGFGQGFGRRFGRGLGTDNGPRFGFRGRYRNPQFHQSPNYAQYSAKDEVKFIESEMDILKKELKVMEAHLSELKKDE